MNSTSTPSAVRRGGIALGIARIRAEILASGANCVGFTKRLTTTKSFAARAARISERWPSWKKPIVGTKPTVMPSCTRGIARGARLGDRLDGDHRLRSSARVRRPASCNEVGAGRDRRGRRAAAPAAASARYARRSSAGSASRWRATVSTSPRRMGPVSAPRGPYASTLSSVDRTSGSSAAGGTPAASRGAPPDPSARRDGWTRPWPPRGSATRSRVVDPERAQAERQPRSARPRAGRRPRTTSPAVGSTPTSGDGKDCSGCSEPTATSGR